MKVFRLTWITGFLLLGACVPGDPEGIALRFSTYVQSPVVVQEFRVNGKLMWPGEIPVQGLSDLYRPHDNAGVKYLSLDIDGRGSLRIVATWVELLTHEAYRAEVAVPVQELQRSASGYAEVMPVFGPGGLLLITSDPIPETPDSTETHDAGRVCGTRAPELDKDYAKDPLSLPALKETLEYDRPAGVGNGCA